MRRTVCIVCVCLILTAFLSGTATAVSFYDVPNDFWANKEIAWTFDRGLMNGTSATTFDPMGNTLRGQMTTILYRYADSPAVDHVSVYSDVCSEHYYFDAAVWAVQNGIMEDTRLESDTMDADEPISRAEFCTMLLKFSIFDGTYVAPSPGTPFIDVSGVGETMEWAIEWAYHHGIVNGMTETTFNPYGTLSRAAAAAMLYRYENYASSVACDDLSACLRAKSKVEELVALYACTSPRQIEKKLRTDFGFSEVATDYGIRFADVEEYWKLYAVSLAETFFFIVPIEPTKEDVMLYLTSGQGFSEEIAKYALEVANISWDAYVFYPAYDWISLTDLSEYGFSATAAWGAVTLKYLTGEEYVITGLPDRVRVGDEFSLCFNGERISCLYFRRIDDLHSHPDSCFYLDRYCLVSAGILTETGVSDFIRNGVPQEHMPSTDAYEQGDNASSERPASGEGGTSVSIPLNPETEGYLVWVPTNGGTKYHSRQSCSQMRDPIQVSIETAKAHGYTPCGRCH